MKGPPGSRTELAAPRNFNPAYDSFGSDSVIRRCRLDVRFARKRTGLGDLMSTRPKIIVIADRARGCSARREEISKRSGPKYPPDINNLSDADHHPSGPDHAGGGRPPKRLRRAACSFAWHTTHSTIALKAERSCRLPMWWSSSGPRDSHFSQRKPARTGAAWRTAEVNSRRIGSSMAATQNLNLNGFPKLLL
jgi:hypothetical protein